MKVNIPVQLKRIARRAKKPPGLVFDCELAARIKEGDRESLKRLVERHIGRLHTYLLHRLGDGQEEIVSRILSITFSEALRRIGPYANGTASTPMEFWLIRLAERAISRLRVAPTSAGDRPASDLIRLREALATMPDRYRFVLSLAIFEQMPAGEIEQTLGVSPARAMGRLRGALKRVGKALDKQADEK